MDQQDSPSDLEGMRVMAEAIAAQLAIRGRTSTSGERPALRLAEGHARALADELARVARSVGCPPVVVARDPVRAPASLAAP